MTATRLTLWTARAAGGLLLAAAVLKAGSAEPQTAAWLLGLAAELALGSLLLLRPEDRRVRAVGAAAFLVFLGLNVSSIRAGRSHCGCFGDLAVSPRVTALIDLFAAASLLATLFTTIERPTHRRPVVGWIAAAACLMSAISLTSRFIGIGGETIAASPAIVDAGVNWSGERLTREVTLTNHSADPVRVLSVTPGCACRVEQDLPLTVPPGGTADLTLTVYVNGTPGVFRRRVDLFYDHPAQTRGHLELRGQIRPQQALASAN